LGWADEEEDNGSRDAEEELPNLDSDEDELDKKDKLNELELAELELLGKSQQSSQFSTTASGIGSSDGSPVSTLSR